MMPETSGLTCAASLLAAQRLVPNLTFSMVLAFELLREEQHPMGRLRRRTRNKPAGTRHAVMSGHVAFGSDGKTAFLTSSSWTLIRSAMAILPPRSWWRGRRRERRISMRKRVANGAEASHLSLILCVVFLARRQWRLKSGSAACYRGSGSRTTPRWLASSANACPLPLFVLTLCSCGAKERTRGAAGLRRMALPRGRRLPCVLTKYVNGVYREAGCRSRST